MTGFPVIGPAGGGGSAATTTFTPAGGLASTNVQAALVEEATARQLVESGAAWGDPTDLQQIHYRTTPGVLLYRDPDFLPLQAVGVVGDGVADDTAAINAALLQGVALGLEVRGRPGHTYKVAQVGTKTFTGGTGAPLTGRGYAVQVPHGCRVDWGGAHITAAFGTAAVLLSNVHTAMAGDVIECRNVVVDGGGEADTARVTAGQPMVWFWGLAAGHVLQGITVQHCSYYGGLISKCNDGRWDDLHATYIRGQGWQAGTNSDDTPLRNRAGRLTADNISDAGTVSQPGNGWAFFASDLEVDTVSCRNCAGGTKIGAWSADVHIKLSVSDGTVLAGETSFATINCGTKVQGNDTTTLKANRVTIDEIVSRNCAGSAFYVRFAGVVRVGSIESYMNARLGTVEDIDADTFDYLAIGHYRSDNAGRGAIQLGSASGVYRFGDITARNFGDVTDASAFGFSTAGGNGRISSLTLMDDRTPQLALKAFNAPSAGGAYSCKVLAFRTNIGNKIDMRSSMIEVANAVFSTGTNPIGDVVTLAAGARSTDVANANIATQSVGTGYVEPIVTLTPMNALAKTLAKTIRYSIPSNFVLRLHHADAIGGEIFAYRIESYTFRAMQFDATLGGARIASEVEPKHGVLLATAGQTTVANRLNVVRSRGAPRTGHLRDVSFFVTVSSGNVIVCVFDTGQTTAGTYTLLGSSGSVAVATVNTWHTWDPGASAIPIIEGQEIMYGLVFDNATAAFGRGSAATNSAAALLPFAAGDTLPKLGWIRDVGSFIAPASIAESNALISGTTMVMTARVG